MKLFFLIMTLATGTFAQVHIEVKSDDAKCTGPAEIFVSVKKTLLYQIPTVVNGDAEVKLNRGFYDLNVVTKECHFKKEVEFEGKQINVIATLTPEKAVKKRKPADLGWNGGMSIMSPMVAQNYWGGGFMPWWNPWMMNYSNWGYPCAWSYFGCQGSFYPRGGPMVMGKPNIYFTGPDQKNLFLKMSRATMKTILASSPAHMEKGWSFDLTQNKIKLPNAESDYLFYDARTSDSIQVNTSHAVCLPKKETLDFMVAGLEARKFPEVAIKDFKEYWGVKLPNFPELCTFPQTETQMEQIASFETNIKDLSWNRLAFVVIPRREKTFKSPIRFNLKNPQKWVDDRRPASEKSGVTAHEWAVGFIFE